MMSLRSLDDSTLWLVGAASFLVGSMGFAGWALAREGMAVFSLPTLDRLRPDWWVFWGFLVGAVGWGLQLTAFFRGGFAPTPGESGQWHWSNLTVAIAGVLIALVGIGVLGLEISLRYAHAVPCSGPHFAGSELHLAGSGLHFAAVFGPVTTVYRFCQTNR